MKFKTSLKGLMALAIANLLPYLSYGQESPQEQVLYDFEEGSIELSQIVPTDASYELVTEDNNTFLRVNKGFTDRMTGVKLLNSSTAPWSIDGYYQVMADVSNEGDEEIQVELFVGNDPDGLVRWYCSNYVDLKPGENKTVVVNMAWTPWVHVPQLDIVGMRGAPGKIKTDLKAVNDMIFCSRYATQPNQFTVDNVRAVGLLEERDTAGFMPFIDQFGQYKHQEWKSKVHSLEALKANTAKEDSILKQDIGPNNRGKYGGWTAGPKLEATGFFRTEKHEGKWWMVDPEGYLFWTAGLNCVSSNTVNTGVSHRENYFEVLPKKGTELAKYYGTSRYNPTHGFYKGKTPYQTYDFYQANMHRIYGADWIDTFRTKANQRFKYWGLNTIGFVSDKGAIKQQKTAYVGSVWIRNTPKIEGSEGFWGKFHDVFDPRFAKAVRISFKLQKVPEDDPWCIGYFVDNEMSWGQLGSLAMGTLRSPAKQAAKQEFIKDLKSKYSKIEALNEVWGTHHASWDSLLHTTQTPDPAKAHDDLVAFYGKIADTYFKTIRDELKQVSPNHNYLGCRFAWANNDVVMNAAAKHMDIVSFNKYEYGVENVALPEGADKPIMIGEFHFGALDRGSFHIGIKEAKDQAERGEMYKSYIQGALRNPAIVGAHWFQYTDEANTGRWDGENYNVGFINVCDQPYWELIEKVRETTYSMYEYRFER